MKTQLNYTVCTVRNQKVILDFEAASMFEVANYRLRADLKANSMLFPSDAVMPLTEYEWNRIKSMYGIRFGGKDYRPVAFTQVGLILLAGLLRQSSRANEISIYTARMFAARNKDQTADEVQRYEKNSNLKYLDAYNALVELSR